MSDTQQQLLTILGDGDFHSGESLGKQLNISRAAVWKQLQKLEELGLVLESVKGTGYRIPGGFELLNKGLIQDHFFQKCGKGAPRCHIHDSLDSTNQLARQLADDNGHEGEVILAEHQTAGRGRRGKLWVSPYATNIYMSVIWGFENGAASLEGLSLAIGVAVKRALCNLGVKNIQLKWPNDIYINNKKLGGILLEMTGDPAGHCSVIVGVGINVDMPEKSAEKIDQEWTDLTAEEGVRKSRNELAAELMVEVIRVLESYQDTGFGPYREEWISVDAFKGERGTLSTVRESISGVILGVDDSGALLLELEDGAVRNFIGGELSLRRAQ